MVNFKNPLYLDFETTFQIDHRGKKNPSPYHPNNYLVSAGWYFEDGIFYYPIEHNEINKKRENNEWGPWEDPPYSCEVHGELQKALNNCDLLVAFNAKFELAWLRACGFTYTGPIHDPMLMAYVLARGRKGAFSLDSLCNRYGTEHRKLGSLVDDYLKKNIGFEEIPWEIVQEYGTNDVLALKDLHEILLKEVEESPHLWPTIDLTHEFCQCLTDIEDTGIFIDQPTLQEIEDGFKKEVLSLKKTVNSIVLDVAGDTPVNLDSPEQLSQLIYSRKVKDKKEWARIFNIGGEQRGSVVKKKRSYTYSNKDFAKLIREHTEVIYKTKAEHCYDCNGKGSFYPIRVDGTQSSRPRKCHNCSGAGFALTKLSSVFGLKQIPSGSECVAVGGFSTDKETLQHLVSSTNNKSNPQAQIFINAIIRINQLEFYLANFIDRIKNGIVDGVFHPRYMQHTTATGRLSSDLQNMPRADKFPLRKCVVSRWPGGKIAKADAKQLEFRIAGELSGSEMIFKDIKDGIDVHNQTSEHTGFNRQDSKPYTFAPVYGATESGKEEGIAKYFRYFNDRYKLYDWHTAMCSSIIASGGYYRIPSGREFYYGEVKRFRNGSFSFATQIKNYPVQAFATADIVPIVCIRIWRLLKENNCQSQIILELHDDNPVDCHPDELELVPKLIRQAWNELPAELMRRYGYELKMPLEVDINLGDTLT